MYCIKIYNMAMPLYALSARAIVAGGDWASEAPKSRVSDITYSCLLFCVQVQITRYEGIEYHVSNIEYLLYTYESTCSHYFDTMRACYKSGMHAMYVACIADYVVLE